jgi:hypothetical protein
MTEYYKREYDPLKIPKPNNSSTTETIECDILRSTCKRSNFQEQAIHEVDKIC